MVHLAPSVFPYKRRKKTLEIGGERELLDFRTEPPKGEEKRGKKKEIEEEILQGSKRDSSSRL